MCFYFFRFDWSLIVCPLFFQSSGIDSLVQQYSQQGVIAEVQAVLLQKSNAAQVDAAVTTPNIKTYVAIDDSPSERGDYEAEIAALQARVANIESTQVALLVSEGRFNSSLLQCRSLTTHHIYIRSAHWKT